MEDASVRLDKADGLSVLQQEYSNSGAGGAKKFVNPFNLGDELVYWRDKVCGLGCGILGLLEFFYLCGF